MINRRTFLALVGGAAAWSVARPALSWRQRPVAIDRTPIWRPSTSIAVEWRYAAGRITEQPQDYGFVVSMTDVRFEGTQELLVQRQDFSGAGAYASKSYPGTLTYTSSSATYTFRDAQAQTLATWQWDQAALVYRLTVMTPELTLQQAVLVPQGDLIAEGGDGTIDVGTVAGIRVASEYYADWAVIELSDKAVGVARVDMQDLRPGTAFGAGVDGRSPSGRDAAAPAQTIGDYDHHWFALAGELEGAPVWVSAWRIETPAGPRWNVTIATSSPSWLATSFTEESAAVAPLAVQVLAWQELPPAAALVGRSTGAAWRLTAGTEQPGDLIDIECAVPPGQFSSSGRQSGIGSATVIEEAVGTLATGTVQGKPLANVTLVVAELSAEFYLNYLAGVQA